MWRGVSPGSMTPSIIAIWSKRARTSPSHNSAIKSGRTAMINKLNHVSIFVLNQESAYDFYVNKLGFKVHTDAPMGPGVRWLTVCSPEQPDLEISLMAITEGMMFSKESAKHMLELVSKGTLGFGVF